MKKIDLGQAVTLLANIGVIAGIVFLGFELRQNNQILMAQASYSHFSVERERRNRLILNDGGITDVLRKAQTGVPIDENEAFRLGLMWEDLIDSWRWQFSEVQAGRLPAELLNVNQIRNIWRANPGLAEWLDAREGRLDPEFVKWMNENVVNR